MGLQVIDASAAPMLAVKDLYEGLAAAPAYRGEADVMITRGLYLFGIVVASWTNANIHLRFSPTRGTRPAFSILPVPGFRYEIEPGHYDIHAYLDPEAVGSVPGCGGAPELSLIGDSIHSFYVLSDNAGAKMAQFPSATVTGQKKALFRLTAQPTGATATAGEFPLCGEGQIAYIGDYLTNAPNLDVFRGGTQILTAAPATQVGNNLAAPAFGCGEIITATARNNSGSAITYNMDIGTGL